MNIKLDDDFFQQLLVEARRSPRKRANHNLHKDLSDSVQRLCIGLIKGTYIRPHHHPQSNKWELIFALRGSIALIIFDDNGAITERLILGQNDLSSGIEFKPGTWHTLFPLTDDAVFLEVKEGPYIPAEPHDFAQWAPEEGTNEVADFLQWIDNAAPGEKYPS